MRRMALIGAMVLLATGVAAADIGVGVHVRVAPRVWIGADWHWFPALVAVAPNPNLAVVDTNIHPKHTRLYLDGRFIGLADDFDGYPDFLYLEPGSYRLECRLGGYRTEAVEIEAEAGYRYDIRFRMQRIKGTKKEHWWERPDRPKPVTRVYGPARPAPSRHRGAPDPSLRPDLAPATPRPETKRLETKRLGSLALEVSPPAAAVYLDGEFLATGSELARLEHPVAVQPGRHTLEVMAPGLPSQVREVDVAAGGTVHLTIDLHQPPAPAEHPGTTEPSEGEPSPGPADHPPSPSPTPEPDRHPGPPAGAVSPGNASPAGAAILRASGRTLRHV